MPLPPSPMSSSIDHPYSYSNYNTIPIDFLEYPYSSGVASGDGGGSAIQNPMWVATNEVGFIPLVENGVMASANWGFPSSFQEQIGNNGSELANLPSISDCKIGFYGNSVSGFHQNLGDFGEECCGFGGDDQFKLPHHHPTTPRENWVWLEMGIQGNQMVRVEEPNIKVGRYTEGERKERILRYLKKRNERNFNKTIKYACRKTLADRRVRVRGRFARNNIAETSEDETAMKKNEIPQKQDMYCDIIDPIHEQLKSEIEEDEWLQEAMANLVYLSHASAGDI